MIEFNELTEDEKGVVRNYAERDRLSVKDYIISMITSGQYAGEVWLQTPTEPICIRRADSTASLLENIRKLANMTHETPDEHVSED